MKNEQQVYWLTQEQLGQLVDKGTCPSARVAWDRALNIKEAGHTPAVYYRAFKDFTVLDENVPEELKRSRSFSLSAKRFPGV